MYFDQRNAKAYSQKAKATNLKELSEIFNFLQVHDIHDIDTLEAYISERRTIVDSEKKLLDEEIAEMKALQKMPEYWEDYPGLLQCHRCHFQRCYLRYHLLYAVHL